MRRFASIKLTWQLRLAVKQNHTLIRITGNIPKRGRQKAICCFNFRVYHAETTWGIIIKNKNVGGVSIESRANIIQLMRLAGFDTWQCFSNPNGGKIQYEIHFAGRAVN